MLSLTKLKGFEGRKPAELSGGQRQRVALARALAKRPKLLLLDEPLSALDKGLREATQSELKALQRETGVTFIVVTHDQDEALTLADRIAVMDSGKIVQIGSPKQIYEQPQSRFVASFLGRVNSVQGKSFRPEHIILGEQGFSGILEALHFKGERQELVINVAGESIIAYAPVSQSFKLGEMLTFKVENEHLLKFTS
jgi:ABC-type sugar transport system ATPase subunit